MTKRSAFTMAEILLSLTIIGVVAAITLPSLIGNINERAWNTQKKALQARFSQSLPIMDNLSNFTDAQDFITSGLSKTLKINNVCDSTHLADCGVVGTAVTTFDGTSKDPDKYLWGTIGIGLDEFGYDTTSETGNAPDEEKLVAAFETQNGESIVIQYNPKCSSDNETMPQNMTSGEGWVETVCANFIYDLNGNKGPNQVGKDIGFMTAFYPTEPTVVAPVISAEVSGTPAAEGAEASTAVAAVCQTDEYRFPSRHEAESIALNGYFTSGTNIADAEPKVMSASKASSSGNSYYYVVEGKKVKTVLDTTIASGKTRCVKR